MQTPDLLLLRKAFGRINQTWIRLHVINLLRLDHGDAERELDLTEGHIGEICCTNGLLTLGCAQKCKLMSASCKSARQARHGIQVPCCRNGSRANPHRGYLLAHTGTHAAHK